MNVDSSELLLARSRAVIRELKEKLVALEGRRDEPVALIGMACRFPGSAIDCNSLWDLMLAGQDTVSKVPAARWDADAYFSFDVSSPGKSSTSFGSFLSDVDRFDAAFFDIVPREAVHMDPQQRLFLEVAWEALEDAGQTKDGLSGSQTAVLVGVHNHSNDYHEPQAADLATLNGYTGSGTAHDVIAGRLAYWLDLHGPAFAVNTACSSSLVAVDLACKNLWTRDCDLAVVGGVNLILSPANMIGASRLNMLSPDGRCKAFDASADGFGRGEGCGVVILKRLSDALRDGDRLHAVVRGTAVNQDGRTNGLTAPNGLAQVRLMRRALERAKVDPGAVGFVEAHGTGTSLGDPIEVEAIAEVYGQPVAGGGSCALGSVKANIGHLEGAAGVAGLIKAVLVLEHGVIPAVAGLQKLNPHLESISGSRLVIPTQAAAWSGTNGKRLAAVSAFGWSGTNAHVILEEAAPPEVPAASASASALLLTVSAATQKGLLECAARYEKALRTLPPEAAASFCFTANTRRTHFPLRWAVAGSDGVSLADQLKARLDGSIPARDNGPATTLADRYERGEEIHWDSVYPAKLPCWTLPARPFDRQRYWVDLPWAERVPGEPEPASMAGSQVAPDDWFYQVVWREKPLPSDERLSPELLAGIEQAPFRLAPQSGISGLEAEAAFWMQRALLQLGLPAAAGFRFEAGEWANQKHVQPAFRRLLERMVSVLLQEGVLEQADGILQTTGKLLPAPDFSTTEDSGPAGGIERAVLRKCGQALPEVLLGHRDALDLLFGGDGGSGAERLYKDSAVMRHSHALLRKVFDRLAGASSVPMRVLELGAGTGSTTDALLRDKTYPIGEYLFTDIARTLLHKAERQYGSLPFFRTAVLDLEQETLDLTQIGTEPFDVIVAANVVHATASLRRSVQTIQRLLKPDGALLLLETTAAPRWTDLVFGLTPGWWRFSDPDLRPAHAIMGRAPWVSLLAESFGLVDAVTLPVSEEDLVEQTMFLARKPVTPQVAGSARRHWVLVDATEVDSTEVDTTVVTGSPVAESQDFADALRQTLAASGENVTLIRAADSFSPESAGELTANPRAGTSYTEVIGRILQEDAGAALQVVLWSACDRSIGRTESLMLAATQLVSSLGESGAGTAKLTVVTRGLREHCPAASALWAFGATAALESEHWGGLIDLDRANPGEQAALVIKQIEAANGENRVSYRNGTRFVARLARSVPPQTQPLQLAPDKAYVVTGASGAVGPEIARWLVDRGARYLVLLSRNGIYPAAAWSGLLQQWEQSGTQLQRLACDVSDPRQVTELFSKFGRDWPKLGGVVHAAADITYHPLRHLTAAPIGSAFATKAGGTQALLDAIETLEPDFLVCFSSAAATLGATGRAHYGAANGYMDALAAERGFGSCQLVSIQWGAWEQQRSGTEQERELIRRSGFRPMRAEAALQAVERLLRQGASGSLVADLDWPVLRPALERHGARAFLSEVDLRPAAAAPAGPVFERPDSPAGLTAMVEAQVREVFGWPPETAIDHDRGFFEMGMDSLMSVELKNRLESMLGRSLPGTLTLNYPSIAALIGFLEPAKPAAQHAQQPVQPAAGSGSSSDAREVAELDEQETLDALEQELRTLAVN